MLCCKLRQALRIFEISYTIYMSICIYMFPSLLAYVCLALKKICHRNKKLLNEKYIREFANNFHFLCELVSETNKLFSMTLGVLIVALVNNVIVWIYFSVVFEKCGVAKIIIPQTVCDCLAIWFVFTAASAVHSEVGTLDLSNTRNTKKLKNDIQPTTLRKCHVYRFTMLLKF